MRSPAELALGIIFVIVSLPVLIYFAFVASTPLVGGFIAQSYGEVEAFLVILLLVGIAMIGHGGEGESKPKVTDETGRKYPPRSLSALEERILILLSEHKTPADISNTTGVSQSIIENKIAYLYSDGYLTDGRQLTEQGYEVIGTRGSRVFAQPPIPQPTPVSNTMASITEKSERGMANTVNAVMFVAYGIFGMALGVALLISAFTLGGNSSLPSLGSMGIASLGVFVVGGLLIVMGACGIVAGAWVWGANPHGIWLGSPLLGIGIVVALFIMLIGRNIVSLEIGATFLGINVIMLALAGIGWDTIKGIEDAEFENSML